MPVSCPAPLARNAFAGCICPSRGLERAEHQSSRQIAWRAHSKVLDRRIRGADNRRLFYRLRDDQVVEVVTIGPYRVLEPLGRGGMGIVYRARHINSERAIALKTVEVPATKWIDSIRREIQALTRIRHPGIVRIVDHGVHQGRPWYAMDLVEGESLRRFGQRLWSPYRRNTTVIPSTEQLSVTEDVSAVWADSGITDSGTRSVKEAQLEGTPPAGAGELAAVLQLMRRVCATLAFLHGEGFINCDLKPENVLLVNDQPVIIDFGLTAHHPGGSGREALEAQRGLSGTLPYMSPEQIRGEFLDARSDLYAVGCMLYELVTGAPPFTGAPRVVIRQHQFSLPTPPSELVSGLSPELERLMLKLLEKNLTDRYGYADEVAAELAELSSDARRLSEFPPARSYLYRPGFVGRDAIVAQLTQLRESAANGSGAFVLLGGESGVGKTRLAMELTRFAPITQMRVVTSEASALAVESAAAVAPAPLHALRTLLQTVADRCQEGGPDVTTQLLGYRRSVLALYEPLLAHVPSTDGMPPVMPLSAEASRQRLFKYLAETIAAFVHEQPLMWVLDDLGWADELSLAFLKSLTPEYLESHALLIIGAYRTEEPSAAIADIAQLPHVIHVTVPRLEQDAVRHMIGDMLALREPLDGFTNFVAEQAEGNPFFVGEYLRTAVSERMLHRNQELNWQLLGQSSKDAKDYETLSLPHSLLALIEQRLRKLSPAAQQIGLAAAVLGREADIDTLRDVAELSEESSTSAIDELLRRQVFEQPEPESVRFAHDKLREVTYAQAPPEQLRDLHSRAASALENRSREGADSKRLWATLGHHFAAAQQIEQAARYLTLAAAHAREIHANGEAIRLYQEAINQAEQILLRLECDPAQWQETLIGLHEALGDVLALGARRDEARAAYKTALIPLGFERVTRKARLHRKLGKTWESEHRQDEALSCYGLAQSVFSTHLVPAEADRRDEWIQLHIELLWVHYWKNRVAEMEAISSELEPVIQKFGTASQRARFFHTQALQNLRRDRYAVSDETLAFAKQAVAACNDQESTAELPMVQFLYGFALLFHDSLESATQELNIALAQADRDGDTAQQARCLTYITLAARRRALVNDTRLHAARSEEVSARSGMREYLAAAWANQAWVALHKGDVDLAKEVATRAWRVWAEINAVFPFHWMALLPLMKIALTTGSIESAVRYAESILAPTQHALPRTITDTLTCAVNAWLACDLESAESELSNALCLADEVGIG